MSNQKQYQNNPLVGFVNPPRTEVRISFTAADLEDMKQYLTGKETQRVYITIKSGEKKDKSGTYTIAEVYDPSLGKATPQAKQYAQSQGAPVNTNQTNDLPF